MPSLQSGTGRPWLSAIALSSFVPAFVVSRLITYFLPQVVIVQSGIHFHHFWYGIILLAAAGWLGIAGPEHWARIAAVMYGLGGGLLADEIGLLLTLGEYQSTLTYTVVVGIVGLTAMGSLLLRYWKELSIELGKTTLDEAIVFSVLFVLLLPILASIVGLQASLVGVIAAAIYRWRRGGPWNISRDHLAKEMPGFIVVLLFLIIVGLLTASVGVISLGENPPLGSLLTFIVAALATDIATGLIGGWVWVKVLNRTAKGPRTAQRPSIV